MMELMADGAIGDGRGRGEENRESQNRWQNLWAEFPAGQ
jgi:hypothetical protein